MEALLEPKPVVLAEERAVCGCAFVAVVESFFDPRAGEWCARDGIVVVPCREEHLEIARTVKRGTVAEMARAMTKKAKA